MLVLVLVLVLVPVLVPVLVLVPVPAWPGVWGSEFRKNRVEASGAVKDTAEPMRLQVSR